MNLEKLKIANDLVKKPENLAKVQHRVRGSVLGWNNGGNFYSFSKCNFDGDDEIVLMVKNTTDVAQTLLIKELSDLEKKINDELKEL